MGERVPAHRLPTAGDRVTGLSEALTALEAALAGTGVPVTMDPGNFTAPSIVVEAPTIVSATQGGYTLEVPVVLAAAQPANRRALEYLLGKLPRVLEACQSHTSSPGIYSPNGSLNFPCYRTTATITIRSI